MDAREPGFEGARLLEASGFVCYVEISTRGIVEVFVVCRFT